MKLQVLSKMMFNTNHAAGKSAGFLLLALLGINFGCGRSDDSTKVVLARYQQLGHRIDVAAESIARTMSAPRQPLATGHLAVKRTIPASKVVDATSPAIAFRVEGVVMNGQTPLVMTSHGVAGIGEEVDGFTVVSVEDDAVTFADPHGHPMRIPLYMEEPAR